MKSIQIILKDDASGTASETVLTWDEYAKLSVIARGQILETTIFDLDRELASQFAPNPKQP